MRASFRHIPKQYNDKGLITLVQEQNVYNLYIKVPAPEAAETQYLCPTDAVSADFCRKGLRP